MTAGSSPRWSSIWERSFDEDRDFVAFADGWMVKHHANCSGLTILERWQHAASKPSRGGAATRSQAR